MAPSHLMCRLLAGVVVVVVTCSLLHVKADSSEERGPNIVLIIADDLGYNDIGYNNPSVITPTLDKLAHGGRVLSQHYSSMMCTPSRAALMSGRYPHKIQMQHFILTSTMPHCMPTDVPVLPETLQTMGYKTHLVGKWHLGYCREECLPTSRGFDTFYGLYGGMADQYSHYTVFPEKPYYDFRDQMDVDMTVIEKHSTDVFSDRAAQIIRDHEEDDSPMFLVLSYTIPHTPLQAPSDYFDLYPNVTDDKRRYTLAMVSHMDSGVRRVVDALEETGMRDDTLIVFMSDNGGDPIHGHSNAPYRGGKGSLWEGGCKTVAFINGRMVKGTASDKSSSSESSSSESSTETADGIFHIVDWAPTLLSIAGRTQAAEDEDGVDQSDLVLDGGESYRDKFVYNIDLEMPFVFGQAATRDGDFKLIWGYEGTRDGWGDEAGSTWNMPWNMQLLGLDPVEDAIVRPPGLPDMFLTTEEKRRRGLLMSMKSMRADDINSGHVQLFNLRDDPFEQNNLAGYPDYADLVLEMKQGIKDIVATQYLKPHPLVIANWVAEAEKVLNPENAWSTGWCNNVSVLVYPTGGDETQSAASSEAQASSEAHSGRASSEAQASSEARASSEVQASSEV